MKKSILKIKVLFTITAIFCFAVFFLSLYNGQKAHQVFAEGVSENAAIAGFEMGYGAEIRAAEGSEKGGIRFTVKVSPEAYSKIKTDYPDSKVVFYTLFARADKIKSIEDLTIDKVHDDAYKDFVYKTEATRQPDGNEITSYKTTYLTNERDNWSKPLMARGVAEISKENSTVYVYASANDNIRTIKELAVSAISDEKNKNDSGLKKYFEAQSGTSESFVETYSSDTYTPAEEIDLSFSMQDGEAVIAVFSEGTRISADLSDGVKIPTNSVTSDNLGDKKVVTLYTNRNNAYTVNVKTITKLIKTEKEFLRLYDYLTVTAENNLITMDGHIVLAENLDFSAYQTNDYYSYLANPEAGNRRGFGWISYCNVITGANDATSTARNYKAALDAFNKDNLNDDIKSKGFIGTFDGNGKTIKGLRVAALGLFPSVGKTGKIINVAFADTILTCECDLFGSVFFGTLDNALLDIKERVDWGVSGVSRIFAGVVSNSIINMESITYEANCALIARVSVGGNAWNDTYVINGANIKYYGNAPDNTVYSSILFDDAAALTAANKSYANYDKQIWDFDSYVIPVFKTYNGSNVEKK